MTLYDKLLLLVKGLRPHCFVDGMVSRWDVLQDWKSMHRPWPWYLPRQHAHFRVTSRAICAALFGGELMENNQEVEPIERCTGSERITLEMQAEEERLKQRRKPERPLSYHEKENSAGIH
jgi:hypothetical protein